MGVFSSSNEASRTREFHFKTGSNERVLAEGTGICTLQWDRKVAETTFILGGKMSMANKKTWREMFQRLQSLFATTHRTDEDFTFMTVWRCSSAFSQPLSNLLNTKHKIVHLWPEFIHICIWHLKTGFDHFKTVLLQSSTVGKCNPMFCVHNLSCSRSNLKLAF